MGSQKFGVDPDATSRIATSVKELTVLGIQVAIVVGGGNLFRGINGTAQGMDRVASDHIGMLATIMNGLALQQALQKISCKANVMSAIACEGIVAPYNIKEALAQLNHGTVLIFVGGTGNPFFTTDSAAALRALEIEAQIVMKGTKVNGIYDKDPLKYPDAVRFDHISYSEVLAKELQVMDATAIALCRENQMPIQVFNIFEEHALKNAVCSDGIGTLVEGI